MKEYLALGLMIVATDFPEAHAYEGRIKIASDGDELVEHVRNYLANPISPEKRGELRASVVEETWDQRTRKLSGYIDQVIQNKA